MDLERATRDRRAVPWRIATALGLWGLFVVWLRSPVHARWDELDFLLTVGIAAAAGAVSKHALLEWISKGFVGCLAMLAVFLVAIRLMGLGDFMFGTVTSVGYSRDGFRIEEVRPFGDPPVYVAERPFWLLFCERYQIEPESVAHGLVWRGETIEMEPVRDRR
ncbi:MAG: hypothetical protein KDB80_11825 [Planctomycetes bacterium]|nr:hypothetical protein [Planctomycetota bacterium]